MKILFVVCTGNTCRSPMGKAILEKRISDLGKQDEYRVDSCGVWTQNGIPASENSVRAMEEIGLDISAHRSKMMDEKELSKAERIYVATEDHKLYLKSAFPQLEQKIEVLNVPDPYGLDLDEYRKCRDAMAEYFNKINF